MWRYKLPDRVCKKTGIGSLIDNLTQPGNMTHLHLFCVDPTQLWTRFSSDSSRVVADMPAYVAPLQRPLMPSYAKLYPLGLMH